MRLKNLLPRLLLGAPLALAACGAPSDNKSVTAVTPTPAPAANATATPTPTPQVVTATVEEVKLTAGGAGEATVRLDIAQGYHVQANPASDKFYVATELRPEPSEGLTAGKPVYPAGLQRKLGFADKPLSVYEGSVSIKLPLRADAAAPKGRRTLRARVRVQPCNDEACLQPREILAAIPVTVN
ncbi:MAG TPA: protein-disulfide reductase DsbD domain-containing protein [Pyrinomonadaceae bacterium]|jgi:hypothetical protein